MRGLLLDTIKQEVRVVDCENDIKEWYKLLNTDIVEMPEFTIGGCSYTIICDENGKLRDYPVISGINPSNEVVLVGNLLIFNTDYEECDVTDLTDDDIKHLRRYIRTMVCQSSTNGKTKEFIMLTEIDY